MVLFGDLDMVELKELPPGPDAGATRRGPATELEELGAWQRVRDEVAAGHRAYVVCPLVDGSERVQARSATEELDRLAADVLAGLRARPPARPDAGGRQGGGDGRLPFRRDRRARRDDGDRGRRRRPRGHRHRHRGRRPLRHRPAPPAPRPRRPQLAAELVLPPRRPAPPPNRPSGSPPWSGRPTASSSPRSTSSSAARARSSGRARRAGATSSWPSSAATPTCWRPPRPSPRTSPRTTPCSTTTRCWPTRSSSSWTPTRRRSSSRADSASFKS